MTSCIKFYMLEILLGERERDIERDREGVMKRERETDRHTFLYSVSERDDMTLDLDMVLQ